MNDNEKHNQEKQREHAALLELIAKDLIETAEQIRLGRARLVHNFEMKQTDYADDGDQVVLGGKMTHSLFLVIRRRVGRD